MRVTVLGSGTLLPDAGRGSAAHLVEVEGARVLLDCGAGVLGALARADRDGSALTHVAFTHFHTDHIGALPSLLWATRFAAGRIEGGLGPLTMVGPVGLREKIEAMAGAFGPWLLDPGRPLEIVELEPGDRYEDREVSISSHVTEHTDESMALRVVATKAGDANPPTMGYTGDTGPTAGLGSFFRSVDLLICECASGDGHPREGHLMPADVAALAREADCRHVVITHVYPEFSPTELAAAVERAGVPGRCVPGVDGLTVCLPEPGAFAAP